MDDHDDINRTLGLVLGELKGINVRLDGMNGRLKRHDDDIADLRTFKDNSTGRLAIIGALFTVIAGAIGAWLNSLFFK